VSDVLIGGRRFPPVPNALEPALFEFERQYDPPSGGTLDDGKRSRWLAQSLTHVLNSALEWHDKARFPAEQVEQLKETQKWWSAFAGPRPVCASLDCWRKFCHNATECYPHYARWSRFVQEKFDVVERSWPTRLT
jgi:hypothetical protein